jgi:hypothetical protein
LTLARSAPVSCGDLLHGLELGRRLAHGGVDLPNGLDVLLALLVLDAALRGGLPLFLLRGHERLALLLFLALLGLLLLPGRLVFLGALEVRQLDEVQRTARAADDVARAVRPFLDEDGHAGLVVAVRMDRDPPLPGVQGDRLRQVNDRRPADRTEGAGLADRLADVGLQGEDVVLQAAPLQLAGDAVT